MEELKVIFQNGREGRPITRIDGRVAFPKKGLNNVVLGKEYYVTVAGENPAKTVYFLNIVEEVEARKKREEAALAAHYAAIMRQEGLPFVVRRPRHVRNDVEYSLFFLNEGWVYKDEVFIQEQVEKARRFKTAFQAAVAATVDAEWKRYVLFASLVTGEENIKVAFPDFWELEELDYNSDERSIAFNLSIHDPAIVEVASREEWESRTLADNYLDFVKIEQLQAERDALPSPSVLTPSLEVFFNEVPFIGHLVGEYLPAELPNLFVDVQTGEAFFQVDAYDEIFHEASSDGYRPSSYSRGIGRHRIYISQEYLVTHLPADLYNKYKAAVAEAAKILREYEDAFKKAPAVVARRRELDAAIHQLKMESYRRRDEALLYSPDAPRYALARKALARDWVRLVELYRKCEA